jgi:hypothetical protein
MRLPKGRAVVMRADAYLVAVASVLVVLVGQQIFGVRWHDANADRDTRRVYLNGLRLV